MTGPVPAKADMRRAVADSARAAMKATQGKQYTPGGKAASGFDCSGFVWYVLHNVFPDLKYVNTDGIASSPLFKEVHSGNIGDIIFFPAGQVPYEVKRKNTKTFPNHVGIVVELSTWIGSQSSTGVAAVPFTNPWWSSRTVKYYRYYELPA